MRNVFSVCTDQSIMTSEELMSGILLEINGYVKRLEKFDKVKMSENSDPSVKSRKSYESVTSNGGLDSVFSMQYDPSSLSSQHKQWIAVREDRKNLVLWKQPFTTLQYFIKELLIDFYEYGTQFLKHQKLVLICLLAIAISVTFYHFDGPHQRVSNFIF
ncbi:vacuole membrane protein 1 [Parasteatoda tepidariorum]|uniref:vacuole membrane protein 1 n=1 Tax=Parasteatoda tepidariorum TaxID=114398 RepID=UPI001C71A27B|nr:vacuole membrane protein 1-like isoform X2 [Parasteatoda tepidariorum]